MNITSKEQLEGLLQAGTDLYNEETGIYVFLYNEKGAIAHYALTIAQAKDLAKTTRETGEEYWASLLGPGGYVVEPEDVSEWCENHWREEGWVVADANYGKTIKLHARITREIEITYEQAESLFNYLSGAAENNSISSVIEQFANDAEPGNYETGYIPYSWLESDLEEYLKEINSDSSEIIYKQDINL